MKRGTPPVGLRRLTRRCMYCLRPVDESKPHKKITRDIPFKEYGTKEYLYHNPCYDAKVDGENMRRYRQRLNIITGSYVEEQ